jgi:hypothetical protein
LGQVEKDCRKAAPKEERVGKTCESNERERTSQIERQKTPGCAWQAKRNPVFFLENSKAKHRRAICVAEWAMGFQNPVQARLRRDLKAQRQLGLPKQSPAFLQLSVQIRVIVGSKK